jgi:hypothetical protein
MITEMGYFAKNQKQPFEELNLRKIPKKLYFGFSKSKMTPFAILSLIVIYLNIVCYFSFTSKKKTWHAFSKQTKF